MFVSFLASCFEDFLISFLTDPRMYDESLRVCFSEETLFVSIQALPSEFHGPPAK